MTRINESLKSVRNLKGKMKSSSPETIFFSLMMEYFKSSYPKFLSRDICQERKEKNYKKKDSKNRRE
jgi:hypothetical protein